MKASIEISKYPLNEKFIHLIENFIERINQYPSITVRTNTMSTQIFGDYDDVMSAITTEIKHSFQKEIPSIFVLKIINSDLS